ncbi:MAG: ABC transporter substrate-binding protein [Anaerolineae bacterium]
MKKFEFLLAVVVLLGSLSACGQPTPVTKVEEKIVKETVIVPQEVEKQVEIVVTATPPPPKQGGVFIEASSADASILNPILWADSASSGVGGWFFPSLLGQDPFTGEVTPTEMAESWETSEDGLTWTFHLRDDVFWSDGEQVDADDFKFTYDAIASENVETPRKSLVEQIESIEVPDPQTIVVTFKEVKCDGLLDLGLGWLPSHLYADDFSDIMENEYNEAPPVSAGHFIFQDWARDDRVTVVRNPDYWKGAPNLEGWIFKIVPDPGARLGQLQVGEVDFIGVQPEQLTTIELDPNLEINKFKDDGYSYIGLNLANPDNPQPGRDEEGNPVEQDPHPILSDINVRKAIAHSLDYETIINKVYLGQGYKIASNVLPAVEWAHDPSIEPYDFDTERAAQLLEEAGWVDSDGDGVREKDGQTLSLTLITNAGNTTREDLGVLAQDQLNSVGFDITFEAIDFGTLVEQLLGQTYDMVIIGWTGLGTDPNDDSFWHTKFDTPGSGFNFVSYHDPEVDELLEKGVSVPGCAVEDRAPYYRQIQQIIHDDVPYVFVTGSVGNRAYTKKWEGINPGPWSFYHNIEQWSLKP